MRREIIFVTVFFVSMTTAFSQADSQPPRAESNATVSSPSSKTVREKGVTLFRSGRFEEAYRILEKLAYRHFEDLRLQYYLGRSAYETGRYKEAAAAFERVLIARPDDAVVKYQMARALFALHNDSESTMLFQQLLASDTPDWIRQEASRYLDLLRQRRQEHRFWGSLLVGVGYDSNAYNAPNTDRFYLPAYQIDVLNTLSDRGDWYHQEALQLHHFYDFGLPGGFAWKNDAAAYFQTWGRFSENNLAYFNYTPGLLYLRGKWLYEVSLGFDKMYFGSDPYLHTFYLVPSVEYRATPKLTWRLSATLQRKYPDGSLYAGRDAWYTMVSGSMTRYLGEKWRLEPGLGLIRERKIDSDLTNVSHDAAYGYLDLQYAFTAKDTGTFYGFYRKRRYRDEDLFFLEKRDEEYLYLRLRYTHRFDKTLRMEWNVDRVDNDSNIAPYDYTKYTTVINLIKEF